MKHPDISEYYKGELADAEEKAWMAAKEYQRNLDFLKAVVERRGAKRVVELGCGSGFIPTGLPATVRYLGIDQNDTFLGWAKTKNPGRPFVKADLRTVTPAWLKEKNFAPFDVVATFAVLKHFGLHEWDDIFKGFLGVAPVAVFDMSITDRDLDNGTDFHHVFVTRQHMLDLIHAAGHKIVTEAVAWEGPFPQGHLQVLHVETEKA